MKRLIFLAVSAALAAGVLAAPVSAGARPSTMTATCALNGNSTAGGTIPTGYTSLQFGWAIVSGGSSTYSMTTVTSGTSASTPANAMTVGIAAMKGTKVLATAYATCQ